VATACGGSSSASDNKVASLQNDPNATDSVTTTTTAVNTQDALLKFAACMRENGVDVKDPTFDANGQPTGGLFGPDSGINFRDAATQTAMGKCRDLLQGVNIGGPGRNFDRTAIQNAMNDFTKCLRDQGQDVADVALPARGQGGQGGPNGSNAPGVTGNGNAGPGNDGGPPDSGPRGGFGPRPTDANGQPTGRGFDPTQRLIERLGLDTTDPKVKAAVDACQPILTTAFQAATTTTTA
jgi:hypothetical protein